MDAYQQVLLSILGVQLIVFAVFTVLRRVYPIIPPMVADKAQREVIARQFRDQKSFN